MKRFLRAGASGGSQINYRVALISKADAELISVVTYNHILFNGKDS